MTVALSVLATIGLVVMKSSLDLMVPRQWIIYQNVSDAYISYEQAYAERISFQQLTDASSPWPLYPDHSTTEIEIGKLPGGHPLMATIIRTRIPNENNIPDPTDIDYDAKLLNNPSEAETWQIQSHLTYKIGQDEYVKSRTIVRSQ
jgi:hypothetical protein